MAGSVSGGHDAVPRGPLARPRLPAAATSRRCSRAGCRGLRAARLARRVRDADASPRRAPCSRPAARALGGRAPLVAGIAALSTAEAVATARLAAEKGCDGLMVLPPYVYRPDRRETRGALLGGHRRDAAALHALQQPDRLRDRRLAGRARRARRARTPNLEAVKESSGDVRRVTAIRGAARRPARDLRGRGRPDRRGRSRPARWAGSPASSTRCRAESVRLFDLGVAGTRRRGAGALRVVPAAAAPGRRAEVRAAHQARAAGDAGSGSERVRPPRLRRWREPSATRRSP